MSCRKISEQLSASQPMMVTALPVAIPNITVSATRGSPLITSSEGAIREAGNPKSWEPLLPASGRRSILEENPLSIGYDDLNPHGVGRPFLPGISGTDLFPSGGMLVGPDHPMFGQGGVSGGLWRDREGRGEFVGGVHQPRYYHIVPPTSGNTSGGLGPNFGTDPQKANDPKGRKILKTGEPTPDHLKPPDWNPEGFI
jgi:hypothetical protein